MSEFEVITYPVKIEPHPNADLLECARIGDYFTVVGKGQFKDGDICAYIPEASVVPDALIAEMGLTGRLAGKKHNRVKATKLRDVVSQGLVYGMPDLAAGIDVTERLGIVKYEPPIPESMSGMVRSAFGKTLKYEIENIKKYPDMFSEGEVVSITEKLHGTWCCFGMVGGELIVTSHGMSDKGLVFDINEENLQKNLYVRKWKEYEGRFNEICRMLDGKDFYILGEIFGPGVQDLKYGMAKKDFRVFDMKVDGEWIGYNSIRAHGLTTVPVLYFGPYSRDMVNELTTGVSTIETADHIREGVVIKAFPDARSELTGGRKIAKSINDDYLFRKGKTTEYR